MIMIMMIIITMNGDGDEKAIAWQPWPVIRVGDGSLPGLVITGVDNNDDIGRGG